MTTTSFHNFLFAVAILLSAETVSAKKVEAPFYKKSEKLVLSYDEFRGMNSEKQEQWAQAIQNFYVNLEKIEKGQRVGYVAIEFQPVDVFAWLKVKALVPKICTTAEIFFSAKKSFAQSSSAAEQMTIQERKQKAFNEALADAKQKSAPAPLGREESVSQVQRLKDKKFIDDLSANKEKTDRVTTTNVGTTISINPKPNASAVTKPGALSSGGTNGLSIDPVSADEGADFANINGTASGAKTNSSVDASGNANIRLGAADGKNNPAHNMFNEDGTSEKDRSAKIDQNEFDNKGQNSCIYAGWVQQMPKNVDMTNRASRCPRVSKMTVDNITYDCDGSSKPAEANGRTITLLLPAAKNKKATVLCNPVVFGLVDAKKHVPLCVEPSSSVTKDCAVQSKAKELDLLEGIKAHRDEYRIVTTRITTLCTRESADLTSHFKSLGVTDDKQIENSKADLKQTCIDLRAQLAEVDKHIDAGSGSAAKGKQ